MPQDIIITPNRALTSTDASIAFRDSSDSVINLRVINPGTLSFDGTSGQLFSITDDLTGTIFSVNDISGIPSIEVNADGTVSIAEFSGNVGVGTSSPTEKLEVSGNVKATSFVGALSGNATTATTATTANATAQSVTFNNGGAGAASGTTFNGSTARTISFNTLGAAPTTHSHTITWTNGTTAGPTLSVQGGTAVAVPDATGSISGIVTTTTQTFAGNKTFSNTVTAATFTETSSIALKQNIEPLKSGLEKILQLTPVSYERKSNNKNEIGLIAEDVAEVMPELVSFDEEGKPVGIHYSKLSVLLIQALKELLNG